MDVEGWAAKRRLEWGFVPHSGRVFYPVIVALSVIVVLLRQAYVFARPQFIWEETAGYWLPTFTSGIASLFEASPVGYLTITSRSAFLVARLGSPETAPILTLAIHGLVIGAVAAFVASDRLEAAIPNRTVRYVFALSLAFLPIWEPFVSVLSVHWFLALFLVAMSLTTERRWWDYPAVALAGLSGIGTILTLPLFLRDRRGVVLLVCSSVQITLVLTANRELTGADPTILVSRTGIVGGVALLLALTLVRTLPQRTVASFAYLALISAIGGLLVAGTDISESASNGRFFLATAAAVTLVAVAGVAQRRLTAIPLAGGLLAWSLASFTLPAAPDIHWVDHARCIGGPVACTVPGYPPEWSAEWRP